MMQFPTINVGQTTCILPNGQASTVPWRRELQKEANDLPKGGLSCPNLFVKLLRNEMKRTLAPWKKELGKIWVMLDKREEVSYEGAQSQF